MRKLLLHMAMSADGFVGGPKGEVDWVFVGMDEGATNWTLERIRSAGVHIMGRKTFHDMAAYWPYSDHVFAGPMNEIPKIAFSKRKNDPKDRPPGTRAFRDARRTSPVRPKPTEAQRRIAAEWMRSVVASGNLLDNITKLKKEPGGYILAHGGAGFVRSLVATGQVDEYHLRVHPVFLGRGLSIFSLLSKPLNLHLVSSEKFGKGVVGQVYRPVGLSGVQLDHRPK
ncbi:MAG: dihydrofolate reductase family protein [Thaumarchaeota archaeon]|nr:dihydrofolate reductase family protein [Nitrososphaerota archaeon]